MPEAPSLRRFATHLAIGALAAAGAGAETLPRGRLIERVACLAPAECAYALYLPPAAPSGDAKPPPVLYAFDAHGDDGAGFAGLFVATAERLGWIVVSAHESSNVVPMEQNIRLARALWVDVHARLAVDERREYAVAFSGLSRFATTLALAAPGSLAGVIGLNGGFPLGGTAPEAPFPFFATVGESDFNYYELLDLETQLQRGGGPERFEIWAGSHEWPPAEVAGRGIEWLELQAMRAGLRSVDVALVEDFWAQGVGRAEAHERAGRSWLAHRAWKALAEDFAGLRETEAARDAVRRHEAAPRFRAALQERAARDSRDRAALARVPRILGEAPSEFTLQRSPTATAAMLERLEILDLRRRAEGDPDPEERLSAERRLYAIYIQAALYLPRLVSERGHHAQALFYLDIAGAIRPEVPHVHFRKAVAHARLKNPRAALDSLRRAVELGWNDAGRIDAEEAFAPLRDLPEMREIRAALASGR